MDYTLVTLVVGDKVDQIYLFNEVYQAEKKFKELVLANIPEENRNSELFVDPDIDEPDMDAKLFLEICLEQGFVDLEDCFGSVCISYNVEPIAEYN